jgi:hypothetical protein
MFSWEFKRFFQVFEEETCALTPEDLSVACKFRRFASYMRHAWISEDGLFRRAVKDVR